MHITVSVDKEELESMKRTVAGKEISIYDKQMSESFQGRGSAPIWMQESRMLSVSICQQRELLHSMM